MAMRMYEYKIHVKVVEEHAQWLNIDMTTVSDVGLAPWLFNLYIDPKEQYPVGHRMNALLASMAAENEGARGDIQEVSAEGHRTGPVAEDRRLGRANASSPGCYRRNDLHHRRNLPHGSEHHYPEEAPGAQLFGRRILDRSLRQSRTAQFAQFVEATGSRDRSPRIAPRSRGLSGRAAEMLYAGSLVFAQPAGTVDLREMGQLVAVHEAALTGAPLRATAARSTAGRSSGRPCRIRGCRGLCGMGGQGAADRGRVGVRRARRARRRGIRLGRRTRARRSRTWPTLAGRVSPRRTCATDGYHRTSPVGAFPAERLWPLRHDRQRLGMDERLVRAEQSAERPRLLRAHAQSARRRWAQSYDPAQPAISDSAQGDQGRLASLRAELLPALPAGGSSRRKPVDTSTCHLGFPLRDESCHVHLSKNSDMSTKRTRIRI